MGRRSLRSELKAAFDEGFACGLLGECWSGTCPYGADAPEARAAWMDGYVLGRRSAGNAAYDGILLAADRR